MTTVLLTGRSGSKSIPDKNLFPLLGRPLAHYPMTAACEARSVDDVHVTTDSPEIKTIARRMGIGVIDRPAELSRDDSELTDAIVHALGHIDHDIDILVTMHCNCALHRPGLVDESIASLRDHPEADACVSGYTDRSVHPYRTKQIGPDGYLNTWLEIPDSTSTNRQALDGCFILDGACRAMRVERCFPPVGQPPFTYLGTRILPIENLPGGDVHSRADIVVAEYYLKELGHQPAER